MGVGGFTVLDPRGVRVPYVQGEQWRKNPVERRVPVPAEEVITETPRKEEPYDAHSRWQSTLEDAETHVTRLPREGREPVAADIMSSPVVSLHPEDTLDEAWQLITTSRFRHVPIIDWEGKLVGMLSDRRMLRALKSKKAMKLIKEAMVRHILCAHPETKVVRIAQVFIKERIGAMPILNDVGELVGMITRSDILRLLVSLPNFTIYPTENP